MKTITVIVQNITNCFRYVSYDLICRHFCFSLPIKAKIPLDINRHAMMMRIIRFSCPSIQKYWRAVSNELSKLFCFSRVSKYESNVDEDDAGKQSRWERLWKTGCRGKKSGKVPNPHVKHQLSRLSQGLGLTDHPNLIERRVNTSRPPSHWWKVSSHIYDFMQKNWTTIRSDTRDGNRRFQWRLVQ